MSRSPPRSDPNRFNALAVVPLVVSDHAVGAVVVHWVKTATISEADKSFLFTITGAAAQAVERARLTLTEFANLERSQHLHHLSSALAAATTPGDVAREAIAGGRRALGAQSAACRVPAAGERPVVPGQQWPPRPALPGLVPWRHAVGIHLHLGPHDRHHARRAGDVDARTSRRACARRMAAGRTGDHRDRAAHGQCRPAGRSRPRLRGRPEPSEPELRFLSTLAGLTAQALERAQLFEQERQALRDAEAGRERLSLLSDVTRLLSSSLDPTTVIQRTMNLVVGRLSDACVVQVPGENGLQRLNVAGRRPRRGAAQRLIGRDNIPFDSDAPAAIAYRTGRTQLAPFARRRRRARAGGRHRAGRAVHRQR